MKTLSLLALLVSFSSISIARADSDANACNALIARAVNAALDGNADTLQSIKVTPTRTKLLKSHAMGTAFLIAAEFDSPEAKGSATVAWRSGDCEIRSFHLEAK